MIGLKMRQPTIKDMFHVVRWRNQTLYALRTPYMINFDMQKDYYQSHVVHGQSRHRLFSFTMLDKNEGVSRPVAFGGLQDIQWENRLAEISLIVDPAYRGEGIGKAAVQLILDYAADILGLRNIWGECYECNPAMSFWDALVVKFNGYKTMIPERKFWEGKFWDSMYFNIPVANV